MTLKLRDLPNKGKFLVVTNDSELAGDGEIALLSKAKSNQIFPILNETTGEMYYAKEGAIYPSSGVYRYVYDVDTDGGATGVKTLRGPKLNANIDVIDGYYDVTTAFVGVGASFSLGTSSTAKVNLKASAVIGTNGTSGRKVIIPDFHANGITNILKLTASTAPIIEVTGAAVTEGALELFLITKPRVS